MRGVYTAHIDISGLNTAKTLVLLEATSATCIEILSVTISNKTLDTNEQLDAGIYRVATKGSPAGTTITPTKHEVGDAAATGTYLGNLSAEPTSYDTTAIDRQGFSNLAGYHYDPLPEDRPLIPPSGLVGIRIFGTVTSHDASVEVKFRVIG